MKWLLWKMSVWQRLSEYKKGLQERKQETASFFSGGKNKFPVDKNVNNRYTNNIVVKKLFNFESIEVTYV